MEETPNKAGSASLSEQNGDLDRRILRTMTVAVALSVVLSLMFTPWRVATGLLLGGVLSLLNYRWLANSTSAALSVAAHGAKPKLSLAQYVLRYLLIGASVFLAYKLKVVSLGATIGGLCSFVVAFFAEAIREFYFAFIRREETG